MAMESCIDIDRIPDGIFYAELSQAQRAAIILEIQLGRKIQVLFPEIGNDYRKGLSVSKLVRKYEIEKIFSVSPGIAEVSVRKAIVGYDGSLMIAEEEAYEGLIKDKEEIRRIGREHNVDSGRTIGREQYKLGKGIHTQSLEYRAERGRQLSLSQGNVLYSADEKALILQLAKDPAYQRRSRIHAQKIAAEVNEVIHQGRNVRKPRDIIKRYSRLMKRSK